MFLDDAVEAFYEAERISNPLIAMLPWRELPPAQQEDWADIYAEFVDKSRDDLYHDNH